MRRPLATLACLLAPLAATAAELPEGFVHLSDVAPSIREDMRYAGADNFTGAPVPGYLTPTCILTRQAAEGLAAAQAALEPKGYGLIVFDCYRPDKAVQAFVAWTKSDDPGEPYFYPDIAKASLIPDGYIADRSGHSRGSTVDLSIIPLEMPDRPLPARPARCDESSLSSTGIEMGTDYDCFSPLSAAASREVGAEAYANRQVLVEAMAAAGFTNLPEEWWHYTLKDEPFPATWFDFDVE